MKKLPLLHETLTRNTHEKNARHSNYESKIPTYVQVMASIR